MGRDRSIKIELSFRKHEHYGRVGVDIRVTFTDAEGMRHNQSIVITEEEFISVPFEVFYDVAVARLKHSVMKYYNVNINELIDAVREE